MAEALLSMYQHFAEMETYPDADHEFISAMKEQTLSKIKAAQAPNPMPGGGGSQMLGMAPPPPSMGPPMGGMAPGGVMASQGPPSPGMPASMPPGGGDELRRLLGM